MDTRVHKISVFISDNSNSFVPGSERFLDPQIGFINTSDSWFYPIESFLRLILWTTAIRNLLDLTDLILKHLLPFQLTKTCFSNSILFHIICSISSSFNQINFVLIIMYNVMGKVKFYSALWELELELE